MYKKIGIIANIKVEATAIESEITESAVSVYSGMRFVSGKLYGKDVVLALSGVGKVFAAVCAQTMIIEYGVDAIINTGVAGTLSNKLSIGDIAIATKTVQHDMDTSAAGDPPGLISGINIIELPCDNFLRDKLESAVISAGINYEKGIIASGDRFICDSKSKEHIASYFSAVACEMEGAAIAQVCYINKLPCAVIRCISDGGNEDSEMDYAKFVKFAAERSSLILNKFFMVV